MPVLNVCLQDKNAAVRVCGEPDGGLNGGKTSHQEATDTAESLQMDEYHSLDNSNVRNIFINID